MEIHNDEFQAWIEPKGKVIVFVVAPHLEWRKLWKYTHLITQI